MTDKTVMAERAVVVVGGANTDMVGSPSGVLLARDSNPGTVRVSPGGVGRNVAENLARLGMTVSLITAFGGDAAGAALRSACEAAGIDTEHSHVVEELPGPVYLAVLDERHDMSVAINDMRALDALTPERLVSCADLLAGAAMVVLDTNVPAPTIEWVASHVQSPIVLEPVSVAKAGRAARVLGRLAAVTPNCAEAGELLGHPVNGLDEALDAARELVAVGVGMAFVTCGTEGAAWADRTDAGMVRAPSVRVANASGAGDAFCAGVAWSLSDGRGAAEAAAVGTAMAALALQDDDTVSRSVSADALAAAMGEKAGA